MIFDVTTVVVLGSQELCPYQMANLSDICWVCSDCSTDLPFPHLGPPESLRHNNIEIRPINNLTVGSQCPSERENHASLTLNPKVEMVKLLKKACQKPRQASSKASCASQPSCDCKGKVLKANQKCYSSEHTNDKKAKQPYCWCEKSFTGLNRRSNEPQHCLKPKSNPEQSPDSPQFYEG